MPIKPPNLDDRRYEDIVAEARRLIPQYCPDWTNLGDADPGITLVQLFAWMTEMTIYRLNRVPDKTYIHFLNFIGEERKPALPSVVPVTFLPRNEAETVEIPPFAKVATRQREDHPALDFLTTQALTVHDANIIRVMAVRGGQNPAVRELPWTYLDEHPAALTFASGNGVSFFDIDPEEYGQVAYTPHQFLYVGHDDFRLMNYTPDDDQPVGRMRIRRKQGSALSIVDLFVWQYWTDQGWVTIGTEREEDDQLGMPEFALKTAFPKLAKVGAFGLDGQAFPLPNSVSDQPWWIRGKLDYERWLSARMLDDLEVTWADDRGGEVRPLNNWNVRSAGRALEFFLQDVPPIRGGWSIRMQMVDRGFPAGRTGYFPRYRWYYRRGEAWEEIPPERVRMDGTEIALTGPLTDMATDGYNIRAERVETVFMRGFCPDLELDLEWIRPVEVHMLAGDDPRRIEELDASEGPWSPFQINQQIPPQIGRKWFIGSDLFANRPQAPIEMEIEVGFEMNGEPVAEPADDYKLQLTYRAEDNWRIVYDKEKTFTGFTFSTLDPEGAKEPKRRKITIRLEPKTQLKGLARHTVFQTETNWIRFELIKANLSGEDEKKNRHPIVPRIHSLTLRVENTSTDGSYEQPMPNPKMAQVDHREENSRLSRALTQASGRLSEFYPFFPFVELKQDDLSLYLQFDKPLPRGNRHAIHFRCRGETWLPEGTRVEWEILERRQHGRWGWRRLVSSEDPDDGHRVHRLSGSGELEFALPDIPPIPDMGFWLRARIEPPEGLTSEDLPLLPPVTHIMLNTVEAVNLETFHEERFSGLGVPHQVHELAQHPIYLHGGEADKPRFPRPETFTDIQLFVEYADGSREPWYRIRESDLLTAGKDDPVFTVDPVDGTLHFGNGIRGRMLPAGTNNCIVERYHQVPGGVGNVGPAAVSVCDNFGDRVRVTNLLPGKGGRDAETIDEIIRRAPSLLTSRDRAVTRQDFEVIAMEASGEVARAACDGRMGDDGTVEVIMLPHRREGELIPDPFLASGLRDHVQLYLKRRCLINVQPQVRLATFMPVDVSVTVRLRPNANQLVVREDAEYWVAAFLDPYVGGLDGEGWPFSGTLYAADFARMVTDIAEVRHVVEVQLYDMTGRERSGPGWEEGEGRQELHLQEPDLFAVRRIRVRTETGL